MLRTTTTMTIYITAFVVVMMTECRALRAVSVVSSAASQQQQPQRLWEALGDVDQVQAWKKAFGEDGERGEYMDGYPEKAMLDRCAEDYEWRNKFPPETFPRERAKMMTHLYNNEELWNYVSMVGFAEHYALAEDGDEDLARPFATFQRQKQSQPAQKPIFSGVVLTGWQTAAPAARKAVAQRVAACREKGIDYIRLECNLGTAVEVGAAAQLAGNDVCRARLRQLAQAARVCQEQEMVPLVLLQVPWRELGAGVSRAYFKEAVGAFAKEAAHAKVDARRLLLETRPPLALSAQEEEDLPATARTSLGLEAGHAMFEVLEDAFGAVPGFCVAGGSTKGAVPSAMQDGTQDAVRQGFRERARGRWGYDACFWEMGAKRMLQPAVGRLWGDHQRDAARELFHLNARELAEEIRRAPPLSP